MTYKEKLLQANHEARATVIGLVVTIAVWAICGFGVSALPITVLSTPLWVFTGCIGTFACAIVVALVLANRVFVDVDINDVDEVGEVRDDR